MHSIFKLRLQICKLCIVLAIEYSLPNSNALYQWKNFWQGSNIYKVQIMAIASFWIVLSFACTREIQQYPFSNTQISYFYLLFCTRHSLFLPKCLVDDLSYSPYLQTSICIPCKNFFIVHKLVKYSTHNTVFASKIQFYLNSKLQHH